MNSNQKGPITPNELLSALMNADFREIQCQDEASKIRQQREILLQLVVEYEQEIRRVHVLAAEEERLLQLREKLLAELELLRNERAVIDAKIGEQINTLRVTPLQDKQQQTMIIEINEYIARNNKLKIRIKDLMIYIEKLQLQNRRLEEERRVVQVNEMQRRAVGVGEDWRVKIESLQKQQLSYEMQIKEQLKKREERTLRDVEAQELEIRQRNERRRAQTLAGKRYVGGRMGQVHTSRYVRQI